MHHGQVRSGAAKERTEVLYGAKKTTDAIVRSVSGARAQIDVCGSSLVPSVALGVSQFRQLLLEARHRGLRHRYVTDVTRDNLQQCRELAALVELRHLDRVRGNFGIVDGREYMAIATLHKARPLAHLIRSNVREIVEQQQYVFDTLWYRAVPFEAKARQIAAEGELEEEEEEDDYKAASDLGSMMGRVYLCRDCMASFLQEGDKDEHVRATGHARVLQLPV